MQKKETVPRIMWIWKILEPEIRNVGNAAEIEETCQEEDELNTEALNIDALFLEAVTASLKNEEVQWDEAISMEEWQQLFQLASKQQILPMIYHSVFRCPAFQSTDPQYQMFLKMQVREGIFRQIRNTAEFQTLYQELAKQGLEPIVVKGITCRMLYPNPDYRISGDEDLYIPEGMYDVYHQALLQAGMKVPDWAAAAVETSYEVAYTKEKGSLMIELHKTLFDEELAIFTGVNEQFASAFEHSIMIEVDGCRMRTMGYTDHLLFLITHAFKHFVNSGFGIRQVCDIMMFANAYGDQIDWNRLLEECKKTRAEVFAASLFRLGAKYLVFDEEKACYPKEWKALGEDPEAILADLLSAGIYGAADADRKHSASITMNAVSAERSGGKKRNSIMAAAFPSAKTLQNRYAYLQKYPFLLPVAWVQRLVKYGKESGQGKKNAADSIKIGNQRIELLRQYGIIK